MSWSLKTCGTKDEVTAAIDEAVAANGGMPETVGRYLKDVVASLDLANGSVDHVDASLVLVESSGHRPMYSSGEEKCRVMMIQRGARNRKP